MHRINMTGVLTEKPAMIPFGFESVMAGHTFLFYFAVFYCIVKQNVYQFISRTVGLVG